MNSSVVCFLAVKIRNAQRSAEEQSGRDHDLRNPVWHNVTSCEGEGVQLQAWEDCTKYPAFARAARTKVGGLLSWMDVVLYNVSGYRSEYFGCLSYVHNLSDAACMGAWLLMNINIFVM